MKAAHLICRRSTDGPGLRNLSQAPGKPGLWRAGNWDMDLEAARELIGGRIFLHETKALPSVFGGEVVAVETVRDRSLAREDRVVFIVRPTIADKGVTWRGRSDPKASYGGVIDV